MILTISQGDHDPFFPFTVWAYGGVCLAHGLPPSFPHLRGGGYRLYTLRKYRPQAWQTKTLTPSLFVFATRETRQPQSGQGGLSSLETCIYLNPPVIWGSVSRAARWRIDGTLETERVPALSLGYPDNPTHQEDGQ